MPKFALIKRFTYFNENDPLYDTEEEAMAAMREQLQSDPQTPIRVDQVIGTWRGNVNITPVSEDDDSSGSDTDEAGGNDSESHEKDDSGEESGSSTSGSDTSDTEPKEQPTS